MKRDLELLRHILMTIESSQKARIFIEDLITPEYNAKAVSYHICLLIDNNYIVATPRKVLGCPYTQFIINRMTNLGHDYLDSIRDDTIWKQTQEQISKVASSVSLDVIKTVAGKITLGLLGI